MRMLLLSSFQIQYNFFFPLFIKSVGDFKWNKNGMELDHYFHLAIFNQVPDLDFYTF